jgi:hypothetical protein
MAAPFEYLFPVLANRRDLSKLYVGPPLCWNPINCRRDRVSMSVLLYVSQQANFALLAEGLEREPLPGDCPASR